jgi:hypothetical protein
MVLGQKHVPQTQLLGLYLQLFDDLRVAVEALGSSSAQLGLEYSFGGKAFIFDEFLELYSYKVQSVWVKLIDARLI